jgi:hypothetical protein
MRKKPKPHSARWLKRHGFTNGLWRLEERDKARKPPPLKVVALRLRYRVEDTNPGD